MADWGGQGAGHIETVSRGDGVVWKRQFVFAEQYAGTTARAAVSGHDDSRQCRSGSPLADGRIEDYAFAGRHRIFDGRAAGISVGGKLSDVCGPDCGDLWN